MNTKRKIKAILAPYFLTSFHPRTIGDDMFCIIETTPRLLRAYRKGSKNQNALIAKVIKEHYGLSNALTSSGKKIRNTSPKSKLIRSYQEFV